MNLRVYNYRIFVWMLFAVAAFAIGIGSVIMGVGVAGITAIFAIALAWTTFAVCNNKIILHSFYSITMSMATRRGSRRRSVTDLSMASVILGAPAGTAFAAAGMLAGHWWEPIKLISICTVVSVLLIINGYCIAKYKSSLSGCRKCGYAVDNLDRCPECGTLVSQN